MVSALSSSRWTSGEPSRSHLPGLAADYCFRCRHARCRGTPTARTGDGQLVGGNMIFSMAIRPRRPDRAAPWSRVSAWARLRGNPSSTTPLPGVALGEPVQQHPDGDVVGHELAAVHVAARLQADRRSVADGRPEQVSRRDVRHTRGGARGSAPGCPFPPRCTKEDDHPHGSIGRRAAAALVTSPPKAAGWRAQPNARAST